MEIIPDASIVVKWYIPEKHHKKARKLRDDYLNREHKLIAPHLIHFEVINALKYSNHYKNNRLIEAADTLPEYGIDLKPYRELGSVAEISSELDISIYDASYIGLAFNHESVLYTSDRKLLKKTTDSEYKNYIEHIRNY